ncbi:MAG: site-2 protease family protein [Clostridia bacterium]|nr:site-2 protease family protein [Clostridia bacterium]
MSIVLTVAVTVIVFGLLIFIHELGHYLVARAFGVGIIEFSVGMGPKIKTWHGKYNDFSIRALPIGGFVNMVGEYDDEIPEEHVYKFPLNSKAVWKRMLIVLAGPFMNILLAFVLMTGIVVSEPVLGSTVVASFLENAESQDHGLQEGDEIIEINGKAIHCYSDMSYKIVADGVDPVTMVVIRDGEKVTLTDVVFKTETESGVLVGAQDFKVYVKEKTFLNVLDESFWRSCSTVYITVDTLIDTFSGRYGLDGVGGPVAIGGQVGEVIGESESFLDAVRRIVTLATLISVSLGVANLLPLPVLDGGRFVLYVIEAIRRKPLPKKIEQGIMAACTIVLLVFMIVITLKDIIGLF